MSAMTSFAQARAEAIRSKTDGPGSFFVWAKDGVGTGMGACSCLHNPGLTNGMSE